MSSDPRPFDPDVDNEDVYDREIQPLMAKIIAICKEHNMPFVASFEFAAGSTCDSLLLPEGCDKRLEMARNVIQGTPPVFSVSMAIVKKDS